MKSTKKTSAAIAIAPEFAQSADGRPAILNPTAERFGQRDWEAIRKL